MEPLAKTENSTSSAFARTGGLDSTVKLVSKAHVLKFTEGGHASEADADLYEKCSALPTELSSELGANHYGS